MPILGSILNECDHIIIAVDIPLVDAQNLSATRAILSNCKRGRAARGRHVRGQQVDDLLVVDLEESATQSVLNIGLRVDLLEDLFEGPLKDASLRWLLSEAYCWALNGVGLTRACLSIGKD